MGAAGLLTLLLLAAWPVLDYLSPPDDPMASGPQFTEPVPVKKAQPALKIAEPLVEAPVVVPVVRRTSGQWCSDRATAAAG
jgi:hypothetical protein